MSFARYPAYKDSGVDWLGKVPAHWALPKLKEIANFTGGGTPSRENLSYWSGDIPWVSPKDMKVERLSGAEESISASGLANSSANSVPPLRVLMVVRSGILKHTIPVAINMVEVALNQDMKALDFGDGLATSAFFLRWVQGLNDALLLLWSKQGATVESLEHEFLANTIVPMPPVDERTAIAAFLDAEAAKIDALIAEQVQLIGLLKEKRQAVISEAVIRGPAPSVLMKDSGVEWLGKVPAHWMLRPLKSLATFRSGGTPDKRIPEYWDGDVPWASAKDLKTERLSETIDHITQHAIAEGAASLVPADAIVVVVRGMILARTFPVTRLLVPMAINQDLKALVPVPEVDPGYLSWLLRASEPETLNCLDEAGHGTKALRMENWGGMVVPVPPISEQVAIAGELEAATTVIDGGLAELELSTSLLRERRSALISATVTGQIDVRQAV